MHEDFRFRCVPSHRELLSIFGLFDGLPPCADQFDPELFQDPPIVDLESGIQSGLSTHCRQ